MLYIRADMNDTIATGHMMRCLAIAEAASEIGEDTTFITADETPLELIQKKGYRNICLHTAWDHMEEELDHLEKVIEEEKIQLLLIDSYYITKEYMKRLRQKIKTVYIDDLHTGIWDCDILINYAIYASKFHYERDYSKTRIFLGCRYAPLRKEFVKERFKKEILKNIQNVLFLTGGTDPAGVSQDFVKSLIEQRGFLAINFHVICGRYHMNVEVLKKMAAQNPNIHIYQNVEHIEKFMKEADIAITAGGTTLYELAAFGVPIICYSMVDNQLDNVQWFSKEGIAEYVGDIRTPEFQIEDIFTRLRYLAGDMELRTKLSENGRNRIDGKGARRIVEILMGKVREDIKDE